MNNRREMKIWRASLCAFGSFVVLLLPKVPEGRQEWIGSSPNMMEIIAILVFIKSSKNKVPGIDSYILLPTLISL